MPCSDADDEGNAWEPKLIEPSSVLSPEVLPDDEVLGSWADRKVRPVRSSIIHFKFVCKGALLLNKIYA